MKKIVKLSLAVAMISGIGAVNAQAADGMNILSDVKVKGQIRPRYEGVNDGNSATKNANALTARTKLSVTGGLLGVDGLSSTIGIISVNNFGLTDYNSGANGHGAAANNGAYAKVIDPQDAMISEATIDYKTGNVAAHVGRSNINLDNQRFIGTVGWRQLERSYDTAYVGYNDKKLNLLGAYVYGFAGVTGVKTTNTASVLLHASYKVMPELKITGYGYLLSSLDDTYGIAATGKINAGAKLTYRAEYAVQRNSTLQTGSQAVGKASASYLNLDLGANISGLLLGFNYEMLSGKNSNGATAFNPHLGTNHKFNGWADQFYVGYTPTGGLTDMNFRAGYKAKGFGKLLAVYHKFTASDDTLTVDKNGAKSSDYGSEIDVIYVNKIPGAKNLKGLLKYAGYTGGTIVGRTNNVSKMWAGLDYRF